jgi:hypothetical protein
MVTIPFGRWGPDAATLDAGLAGEASGVRPGLTSYLPFPQMAASSLALAAACRGAFTARTTSNAIAIFAGTSTKLYKFAGVATAWTDYTRLAGGNYAVGTDDLWQFAQFGDVVFATQITDALQGITLTGGVNFAAAAGSPPKGRYIGVVGDFLILGNTDTSSKEVRWSARNDAATWTKGQKDADSQTFPDGGDVMGLAGFEQGGLIFQTDIVRRMMSRQDAAIFEFHRIETSQGTLAPYSIINRQGTSYYYGTNGFQMISLDGSSAAIGANWVDAWFIANSNASTRPKAIIGSYDPASPQVFWLFAASGNATSSTFDHVLCFDPTLKDSDYGPWTHAPISASMVFPAATTATTLENLGVAGLGYTSMDTLVPYSLDADIWKGGAPRIGLFDSAFKLNFLTGTPMAATLQTGLFQPIEGKRCFVNGFRFVGDSPDAIGRIYTSERQQSAETPGATSTVNAQGIIYRRASGRHIRMEVTIPAGAAWTKASGISLDDPGLVKEDGQR